MDRLITVSPIFTDWYMLNDGLTYKQLRSLAYSSRRTPSIQGRDSCKPLVKVWRHVTTSIAQLCWTKRPKKSFTQEINIHNNLLEKSWHSHFSVPRLSSLTFLKTVSKRAFSKRVSRHFHFIRKRKSQKSSNKRGRTGASLVQETKVNDTVSLQSRAQLPKTNFNVT